MSDTAFGVFIAICVPACYTLGIIVAERWHRKIEARVAVPIPAIDNEWICDWCEADGFDTFGGLLLHLDDCDICPIKKLRHELAQAKAAIDEAVEQKMNAEAKYETLTNIMPGGFEMTATDTRIRHMVYGDLEAVLRIEAASFPEPWNANDFIECMRHKSAVGIVAEEGNRIVGYHVYEHRKGWFNLINFAVDPEYRRQGVGRDMMARLIDRLVDTSRTKIRAFVPESAVDMQLFLKRCRFRCTETLERFFDGPTEDGYLFVWRRM